MELTEIEKLLTGYLQTSKASKGEGAAIFLTIKNEEGQLAMCKYLSQHPEAMGSELLTIARKIAGVWECVPQIVN